jgi:hypothetical protein
VAGLVKDRARIGPRAPMEAIRHVNRDAGLGGRAGGRVGGMAGGREGGMASR